MSHFGETYELDKTRTMYSVVKYPSSSMKGGYCPKCKQSFFEGETVVAAITLGNEESSTNVTFMHSNCLSWYELCMLMHPLTASMWLMYIQLTENLDVGHLDELRYYPPFVDMMIALESFRRLHPDFPEQICSMRDHAKFIHTHDLIKRYIHLRKDI